MEHFNWVTGALFPYINFALFAYLAFKMFRGPLRNFAATRHAEYKKLVEEASKAKALAEAESAALRSRLAALDAEIVAMRDRAALEAKSEAQAIVDDARRLAEHLRSEARRIADTEVKEARAKLQKDVIETVRRTVAERIGSTLDAQAQRDLVSKRIAGISHLNFEA